MKLFDWNTEKNQSLMSERGISFEDVVVAIEDGKLLERCNHHDQLKYPGQKIMIVNLDGYAYVVPYVEDEYKIFLKTIFPSRKHTKFYLNNDR